MAKNTSEPKLSPEEKRKAEVEAIAAELIAMIEAGTAPWQKPWTPAMGSDMPFNHVTGTPYHGFNALKLLICGRDDPRWMTYKQAQETGAQVRKGERGIGLVRVITHEVRAKRDENGNIVKDQNGETVQERVWLERPIFKAFTVFNAEQIDGLPEWKPEPLSELTWDDHSRAERILAASGADILHKAGDAAYYRPGADIIVLPEKNQFAAAGDYYATALHELGHWTGHESCLNRDLSGGFGSESYAREELRAEIASMMMSRVLGIPHHPERHASYVENWIKILQNDPEEILRATTDAGHIRSYLLDFAPEIHQEMTEPQREPIPTADKAVFLHHEETQPEPDKETAMNNPSREPAPKQTALFDALHQAADHARQNGTDIAHVKQLADSFAEQHRIEPHTGERFTVQTMLFTAAAEAAEKGAVDADWLEMMARAYARDFGEGFAPVEAGVRPLPDADASLSDVLQMAVDDTLQRDRADAHYLEQLSDAFAEHHQLPPDSEARFYLNAYLFQVAGEAQWDRDIDADLVQQTAMAFEERFGGFRKPEGLSSAPPENPTVDAPAEPAQTVLFDEDYDIDR